MYRSHVSEEGWQEFKNSDEVSGTLNQNKQIEAIQIRLKRPIEGYRLYYRAHVEDEGWQELKAEDEIAGTTGKAKRVEAIQIKLVRDNKKVIMLDPGHNFGGDDGAYAYHYGVTYCERDLNMQVSMKLKRELEFKGYTVFLTRTENQRETCAQLQSLQNRVNIANASNANLFISIHHNSFSSSSLNGVETYYSSSAPYSGEIYPNKVENSKSIAQAICDNLAGTLGRANRGARDSQLYVVRHVKMPAVLIECGYLSNYTEARNVSDSNQQQRTVESIANMVSLYY